jgi:beta-phosphoglucomutase family hydrolase
MTMLKKQDLRAFIFDMDGVIVDNHDYHHEAWMQFFQKYQLDVSGDVSRYFGRTNTDILTNLFPEELSETQLYEMAMEKEKLYRKLYEGNIVAADGLEELLSRLQDKGYKLAVATSAPPENLDFVLGHTGLHRFFDVTVNSSMISKGKPDPEIYLRAAMELEVSPEECVVVEDSLAGIRSGRAAGMQVVAISSTNTPDMLTEADMIIGHFDEIDL